MSCRLTLKSLMLFLILALNIAWSSPAMSASDTKKDKKSKPTSEASKKPEAPKKADGSSKKPAEPAKKPGEPAKKVDDAKKPDDSSRKSDEAAKKPDESDPLQACLGKIPEGATFGQRMLAEQSCTREEDRRNQTGSAARF